MPFLTNFPLMYHDVSSNIPGFVSLSLGLEIGDKFPEVPVLYSLGIMVEWKEQRSESLF